ncbi:MAG TPA: prepilin-type N-terminal cleavage/methylation domain-containing protein [Acetobacteraceae bacterium]|jgi:prepilin-type N-terminal cleavage/methylation domain-containing protein|nr:prepilin-type N-terminal cleavage/methylation domain-containing protein [Acetobacteraceae bacterium]
MRPGNTGFSLLEVLVVVAVAGMILVLLDQGLRVGLRGTESYFRAVQSQSGMEPVDRVLRNMIEHMEPGIYPDPAMVSGTGEAFAFTTELPNPATGGTLTADVRLEVDNGRLVLWWTPHTRGIPFNGPPPPHREVLLRNVASLKISYAATETPRTWISRWDHPVLPGLVRFVVVPANAAEPWPEIIARPQREQAEE